jgi:hypothetical protein
MVLKETNGSSLLLTLSERLRHNYPARFYGLMALIFIASICGAFVLGANLYRSGVLTETIKPAILSNTVFLAKRAYAFWARPEVESLVIDIKHKDFMKLAYCRQMAMAQSVLFTSDADFVNGDIRHNDKMYRVSLRLKGDEPDHFAGDKWSLRVNIKGENTLFGMKRFALQHPRTRNFVYEWLLHQALRMEGLIYHRYQFVNVTINGKDMGIYALEEHMDKQLIEHNERRDGPILRFGEELIWKELVHQIYRFEDAKANGNGAYTASEIEAFQLNKWGADSLSRSTLKKAVSLLESFRRGILTTSDVFDVDKLATYFALMDLFGASNGTKWVNIRFYYNPITSRLEPIGRDGSAVPLVRISAQDIELTRQSDQYSQLLYVQLFSDSQFYARYCRELERMSQVSYLDHFFAEVGGQLADNLFIIYSEFPNYIFSKEQIYRNQEYIRTVLNPVKGFHAHFKNIDRGKICIELGNIQTFPAEVLSCVYRDSLILPMIERQTLPAFYASRLVDYQDVEFELPHNLTWADSMAYDLKIDYRLLGTSRLRQEPVLPARDFDSELVAHDYFRQRPNFQTFDFVTSGDGQKEILIKPGHWTINRSLIIPKGYRVICGPATQLNLIHSSAIISYSPIEFIGSDNFPIVIESPDSTGQGLLVVAAEGSSILENVTFKNLSNPHCAGWEITGAVTFYEADVDISHCQFLANRSEDGLNIIRSEFSIDHSLFSNTFSDAFDGDFIKGEVTNTAFVNCGNDGIDVSGSVIHVQNIFINNSGDKGLSNGENSQMTVTHAEIKNAAIAVASKDISLIKLADVTISGGQIGLTAYQKKPEFGPGSIEASGLHIVGVAIPYLVEERSQVTVDQKKIEPSRDNVKDILYGVEYGKSSK